MSSWDQTLKNLIQSTYGTCRMHFFKKKKKMNAFIDILKWKFCHKMNMIFLNFTKIYRRLLKNWKCLLLTLPIAKEIHHLCAFSAMERRVLFLEQMDGNYNWTVCSSCLTTAIVQLWWENQRSLWYRLAEEVCMDILIFQTSLCT